MSIENTPDTGDSTVVPFPTPVKYATEFDEYNALQAEYIKDHAGMLTSGFEVDVDLVVAGLLYDKDNSITRKWAVKNKICTASEFNKALNRARIKAVFGCIPQTATQLIDYVARDQMLKAEFNGLVKRPPATTYMLDGKTYPIVKEEVTDGAIEAMVHMCHKTTLTLSEICRELRLTRSQYKLPFVDSEITDAVATWHEKAKAQRFAEIGFTILASPMHTPSSQTLFFANPIWQKIATNCFDLSEQSAEYVIAVLKKFMWQVKRKMRGQEVTNHLMPVFLGPQGAGKSTFVKKMIGPVHDLVADTDFGMIEDTRNINLWHNYVLFLDEMGFASKSDVDVIKHAITAETLSRRPMGTNLLETVDQRATFIGCSNRELAQLIKDATGLRRFAGLRFKSNADWALINSTDWTLLWQSVDQNGPDPMDGHRVEMKATQEQDRETTRVETWMAMENMASAVTLATQGQRNRHAAMSNRLYLVFQAWEADYFKGGMPVSLNEFGHEMTRLINNAPATTPFKKKRTEKGIVYVFNGALGEIDENDENDL